MFPNSKFNASFFIHLALFILFSLGMVIPKGYSWGTGVLLVIAFYIVLRYRKEINFKAGEPLVYALLAYVLVSVSVNLIAGHSGRDYELDAKVFLTIPILYALVYQGFNRNYLILAFGLGGLAMGIDSIYEFYVLNLYRVGLYPIRYGYIGAWLAVTSLISLVFFAKTASAWTRVILLLGILGGVTAAILSGTRGSWVFLGTASILLMIYVLIYSTANVRRIAVALFLIGFAGIVAVGVTDNPLSKRISLAISEIEKYQANHKAAFSSVGMRIELWRLSAKIVEEHPFVGIGADNFRGRIEKFVKDGEAQPYMKILKHTHNDVLDKVVKTGILSGVMMIICLYLLPLIMFLKKITYARHEVRYYAVLGSMLVVAWIIFGLTNIFLLTNVGAQYYLVSLAIFWAGIRRLEKGEVTTR